MKKNKSMRLAAVLLVLVLLTTSVIGGTFAKYTSGATASDEARVAKWSFTVGGQDIAKSEAITFELFNTVEDTLGGTEANVENKLGDGKTVIAPGTTGSFDIELENASEVTATYAIKYTVDNQDVPIEYSVDNGASWTTGLADVAATNIEMGASATITVQWRWAFVGADSENYTANQTDAHDTQLGVNYASHNPSVTATITATQVN